MDLEFGDDESLDDLEADEELLREIEEKHNVKNDQFDYHNLFEFLLQ